MQCHQTATHLAFAASILLAVTAGSARAQSLLGQNLSAGSLGQAASGLLGGHGAPDAASAPPGNIAGVLSYCSENGDLEGSNPAGTIGALAGKGQASPSSSAFQAGRQGLLQTGQSGSGGAGGLSLSKLPDNVRQRVCTTVLNRARSML